jgi:quinol monooxygenase YgiN
MIIVVAQLRFADQADRDRAVELSAPVQKATRDEEAGCHAYCFAADPCEPTAIQVYELWQDGPSLAAHFKHPNYEAMVELLMGVGLVESVNRAYLTERDEPVYGEEGERKEAFFV